MKTNEAPEKIYLERILCSDEVYDTWKSQKTISDDIEYIRKDAFTEKACGWIKENITNSPNANSVLVRNGCVTLTMLIEDFKKYMND